MPLSSKKRGLSLDSGANDRTQGESTSKKRDVALPLQPSTATQRQATERMETDQDPSMWVILLTTYVHVTIQRWQGEWCMDLRHQENKDGRLVPTKKGISLTIDKARKFVEQGHFIQSALDAVIAGGNASAHIHLNGNLFVTMNPAL